MTKPYYEHKGITIYHGDCLEILPQLDRVDLVITSPPYNLGNKHHTDNFRHNPYNDDMEEKEYQRLQVQILEQIYEILNDSGSLFYNHKNRFIKGLMITPYVWLLKTRFIFKQEIVWNNGSPCFDRIRFAPFTERIYWMAKRYETVIFNKKVFTDDWHISPVGTKGKHTRAYPIEIPQRIIFSNPNAKTVCDPYMGSGRTLEAAKLLNRKAIGIEIEEKYCEIAVKRLSQEVFEFN